MAPEFSSTACGLLVGDQPRPHHEALKLSRRFAPRSLAPSR